MMLTDRREFLRPAARAGAGRDRRRGTAAPAGGVRVPRLHADEIFDFARNAIAGRQQEEFAGSTFAPDRTLLFVNIQAGSGVTFAIWGPWKRGVLQP
jgi:secreted PhoX family phosphatase